MISVKHHLLVPFIASLVQLIESIHQPVRTRIVDGRGGDVIGLLEIPGGIFPVGIFPVGGGIGGDVVGILEPPAIGKVSLGKKEAGNIFGCCAR